MSEKRAIVFRLKSASNQISRCLEFKMKDEKSTSNHGYIIGFILQRELDEKVTYQKDIEEKFDIRRSTATGIINLMEKNDLIKRMPDEKDSRLKRLVPTKKAIEIHKSIEKKLIEFDEDLQNGITREELNSFFNILAKIKANAEKSCEKIMSNEERRKYDKKTRKINKGI